MNAIYLLVDYLGLFYSSVRNVHTRCTMNVATIAEHFRAAGYELVVQPFSEVDFRQENYAGKNVLYQSSEDCGLLYKNYIEDVLLGLMLQGTRLIPPFPLFRAHHNKVFMEILRDLSANEAIKNITSKGYGVYEEFARAPSTYPKVIKTSEGAGSKGVRLIRDSRDKSRYGMELSNTKSLRELLREYGKRLLWRGYVPHSLHRRKFVVQNFIAELEGDYKILVYGDRYYILHRKNRPRDFRASGSGNFQKPSTVPPGILDFAKAVFESFDTPFISLDVAASSDAFYLLEFQCLSFGPLTLENSDYYFVYQDNQWQKIIEKSSLEEEFVRSVVKYLRQSKLR
jgi:hypothetical protein